MSHPSQPEFWNSRYEAGQMPWEFAGVPADLQKFLKQKSKGSTSAAASRGRVLIPGCGSGHEIRAFLDAGFEVLGLDFAAKGVERARQLAGPGFADRIVLGDFFTHDLPAGSFDYVYERTFLCSLTPDRREAYRNRVFSLLKPGGHLIGYFYYQIPVLENGPPYGFAWGTADELFARHFILTKDQAVADSLPLFAGRERWQEQRRTSFTG
ncbi:MAG: methyltransferase domain-containing protein [Lacunisphaera sp.]|nr:methyltransferase domain-containing protein [Lacunisphaera sp.]